MKKEFFAYITISILVVLGLPWLGYQTYMGNDSENLPKSYPDNGVKPNSYMSISSTSTSQSEPSENSVNDQGLLVVDCDEQPQSFMISEAKDPLCVPLNPDVWSVKRTEWKTEVVAVNQGMSTQSELVRYINFTSPDGVIKVRVHLYAANHTTYGHLCESKNFKYFKSANVLRIKQGDNNYKYEFGAVVNGSKRFNELTSSEVFGRPNDKEQDYCYIAQGVARLASQKLETKAGLSEKYRSAIVEMEISFLGGQPEKIDQAIVKFVKENSILY